MVSSYFERPQEEEDTFEEYIEDEAYVEPPHFDICILTPEQRVELYRLLREKENWGKTRRNLAQTIRVNLIRDRAEFEGRDVTNDECRDAYDLKEVPPTQLEGICNSTLELHFEDICLTCVEDIASDFNSHVLINKCLDPICETRKLDGLRVEKLARDHIEVCFDKNYLCALIDLESEFLMLDEPRPLLELVDLGDELDVDKLLLEMENPLVKNIQENENIVFYLNDGDRVDNFVKNSFEPVVNFVFPPNAFASHDNLNLKEHFIIHATSLVKLFEEKSEDMAIDVSQALDSNNVAHRRSKRGDEHRNGVGDLDERSHGEPVMVSLKRRPPRPAHDGEPYQRGAEHGCCWPEHELSHDD
ncbi:hypothetical protein Bca101_026218 [Brassica carinata]